MNKDIEKELNKCKIAKIPEYSEDILEIVINKHSNLDVLENHYYQVKLEDYIVHEPDNFNLSSNWNNGQKPPEVLMVIKVEKIVGKMIKVEGIGKESAIVWSGWLPRKSVEILEELK